MDSLLVLMVGWNGAMPQENLKLGDNRTLCWLIEECMGVWGWSTRKKSDEFVSCAAD